MNYDEAKNKLAVYGQEHVLRYFGELNGEGKQSLLSQIEKTDLSFLNNSCACDAPRGKIEPIDVMRLSEIERNRKDFTDIGLAAIRAGRVGAALLAGGMGTRLGSDQPKGMFDIGITRRLYIFERLINNLLDVVRQAGAFVPLYIMTSDKNDAETRGFFADNDYFGYDGAYVSFFVQKMAPATDRAGKLLLESKNSMALSPNGNGGWFESMSDGGLIPELDRRGVEWLNVFSVDNVLQRIADPAFIGAVISRGRESGAKVIRKSAPGEKVGTICLEDGRPSIVEYYELTPKMAGATDASGEPVYNFGVTLNYLFGKEPLKSMLGRRLPLHRVEKKIPCLDGAGNMVNPEAPNGYKYESLVLDMVHMMSGCLPFEIVRELEFAPVKNREGRDSVVSARELLAKNGVVL